MKTFFKKTYGYLKDNLYPIAIITTLLLSVGIFGTLISMNSSDKGLAELGANSFLPSGISVNIRQDLIAGAARSNTTLNIDPIVTLDGRRVTMSDIGSIAFGKLDQGKSTEEIISWTGMTDNTTYYTLTGLNWGYNFYNAATSTSNYKRHSAGSTLIITNDWHFVNANYPTLSGDETISGVYTFSGGYPGMASTTYDPANNEDFATKYYVDNVATSGAANATETVKGIVELATREEMALGTGTGGTGANMCLQSAYATSTGGYLQSILVTDTDGKLDQSFLDLTEDFTFSGTTTFSGDVLNVNSLIYGDGSDGASTITENTTLTADKNYTNLTINTGVTLYTGGYRIFVSGTLTNNGTIDNSGLAGNGNASGSEAGGIGGLTGTIKGGSAGGAGVAAVGGGTGGGGGGVVFIAARIVVNNGTIQANGGGGGSSANPGSSGGSTGGNAGVASNLGLGNTGGKGGGYSGASGESSGGAVTSPKISMSHPYIAFLFYEPATNKTIGGGAGGGSGGRTPSAGGGGGGGGGGGYIYIVYQSATWGTEQALGGAAGLKYSTGSDGIAGSNGTIKKVQIL